MGIVLPWVRAGTLRLVLPARRSLLSTIFMGGFFAAFCVPYVTVLNGLNFGGSQDLSSLTTNLFLASFLLVWSIVVVILGLAFLMMIVGRDVIIVKPGSIHIRSEILCLGGGPEYGVAHIRNLRKFEPREESSDGWRGQCLAFDYNGSRVTFGSNISGAGAAVIMSRVERALGVRIPTESGPQDLPPGLEQDAAAGAGQHSLPEKKPSELPPPATSPPVNLTSPSTLTLILANLVPIAGVAFMHWDLGDVMLLFWTESAVIGFFNILKMAVIGKWGVLLAGPFFAGHYGAFMSFHLMFIYLMFIRGVDDSNTIPLVS